MGGGTTVSGANQPSAPSLGIAECLPESKCPASTRKNNSSSTNTLKPRSSKTSARGSTSTGGGLRPYWNGPCVGLQSQLWLPHKTVSAEPHSPLSSGLLNYREGTSSHWKRTLCPTSSIPEPCLPSLPPSVPATTENAQVAGSAKIRIFPKNESAYFDLLALHRRAYNLTIEWFRGQERVDFREQTAVRKRVRDQVREEWAERAFASVVADEAVNKAFDTFKACLKKWAKGQKAKLHFKSRKDPVHSFVVQKYSKAGPYPRVLGPVHITEEVPGEAIASMATVTRRHGRWYIQVKKHITICRCDNQAQTVVALDPGVRTFMTAFSPSEAIKFGEGFASSRIHPLLRKRDTLLGKRQKLLNARSTEQWWYDQMRCANKRIDRLSARIDDQVGDLHRRVAHDLVSRYGTIICPPFETSQMVAREGRKLRRSSVREMQSLGHYQFQQQLKWMCRRYGRKFVACSEAYTSKTRSWDGVLHHDLGSATTISDGRIEVDRDHNGARGIFLLAHTRQLTPCSDPNVTVGTD